jgi:hypothetical protein
MKHNLDFDGLAGDGVNRAGNKYSGNQSGLTAKMNYGNKSFKGNASDSAMKVGPSVTRDPAKKTIATAAQGGRIDGGAKCGCVSNPDKINMGMK